MNGDLMAFKAAGMALLLLAVWAYLVRRVRVPRRRGIYVAGMAAAALLGVASLVIGTGVPGAIAAVIAIAGGGMFVVLRLLSAQERPTPAVAVGEEMLWFSAVDDRGAAFDLADLRGNPFLLKFFRGHW